MNVVVMISYIHIYVCLYEMYFDKLFHTICISEFGSPSSWARGHDIPFVVGFLELETLTMFHKVNLCLIGIVGPFILISSIVLFDAKSYSQIFDAHLFSLMFEVILEVFPSLKQLLYNSCNLKSFA